MKLIAGLGNPGKRYEKTRHNIGFRVIDSLAHKYKFNLKRRLFEKANTAGIFISAESVTLLQPLTYMNLSGVCVLNFCRKLKIDFRDLLIVCDDISLPLGKIRIRASGSAGGHKGLSSLIGALGTDQFPRLRVGIKTEDCAKDLSDFVLSNFAPGDEKTADEAIEKAVSACESWVREGIDAVMNKFN